MKKKPSKKRYSETWWALHNSVRFCLVWESMIMGGNKGIMVTKTRGELKPYTNQYQRIVKVRITEIK